MAWTVSGWQGTWFYYGLTQGQAQTHSLADPMRVALYDNTRTPNPDALGANGYGTGVWAAGEVTGGPGWPAGGLLLDNVAVAVAAGQIAVTADPVHSDPMTPVPGLPFGSMIYDSINTGGSLARTSLAFHYFGGGVRVAAGDLILLWGPDGVAVQIAPLRPGPPPLVRRRRKAKAAAK
jgi:hypothetical protein